MLTVIREMAEESERKEHRAPAAQRVPRGGARARARTRSRARRRCSTSCATPASSTRAAPGSSRSRAAWSTARPGEELPEAPVESGVARPRRDPPGALRVPLLHGVRRRGRGARQGRARERARARSATRCSSSATRPRSRCTCTPTIPGRRSRSARALGVVEGVEIANMHHQTAQREERLLEGGAPPALATLETGLVAVCPGRGNRRLFESLGATRVIEGGQSMNPSAADILDGDRGRADGRRARPPEQLERHPHRRAGGGAQREDRARGPVEVGAGGLRGDGPLRLDELARRERAGACSRSSRRGRTGEITVASRDAKLDGVEIREGDVPRARGRRRGRVAARTLDAVVARGRRPRARRRPELPHDPDGRGRAAARRARRGARGASPRARASRSTTAASRTTRSSSSRSDRLAAPIRVLLVEDNDVYRDSLVFLLGRVGRDRRRRAVADGALGDPRASRARPGRRRARLPPPRRRRRDGRGRAPRAMPGTRGRLPERLRGRGRVRCRVERRRCARAQGRGDRRARRRSPRSGREVSAVNLTSENTAIVLDSTSDYPDAPARFPNMRFVPLYVRFGDETYRDYVELGPAEFYEKLRVVAGHAGDGAADAAGLRHRLRGARARTSGSTRSTSRRRSPARSRAPSSPRRRSAATGCASSTR